MRFLKILGLNLLLTVLECGLFGPAASKLDSFGLRGWAARTPFYLLPLYLTPMIVLLPRLRASLFRSALVGAMLTIPSGLWVIAAKCPLIEAMAHVVIGMIQGFALAWLAGKVIEEKLAFAARMSCECPLSSASAGGAC